MREALAQAEEARAAGEVPVGCVIVHDGRIIARGRNRREEKQSTLSHAETEAIREANRVLGSWRLEDCALYVTLEPCPMCAGAILNARISTVVFGAWDPKAGACGSVEDLCRGQFPHRPEVISGILERECEDILKDFFKTLR